MLTLPKKVNSNIKFDLSDGKLEIVYPSDWLDYLGESMLGIVHIPETVDIECEVIESKLLCET